ncbi:LOW QUALITY PROTEIN: hypothetical protein ACHAXN_000974, partial [Cyclotella atomus]
MQAPQQLSIDTICPVSLLSYTFSMQQHFLVKSTWLAAIKAGNFASWLGLTDETNKGHLFQVRQGIRSTKPKPPPTVAPPTTPASSSNSCLVGTHQQALNRQHGLLLCAFSQRQSVHHASISLQVQRHSTRDHTVDHQVLDNEASAKCIQVITEDWKATYHLVPPDIHRRNLAERAIQTFKAHFLSILAGISKSFPNYLWDKLLPQTELTLNLLRQLHLAPPMSAWEYYNNAPFNFEAAPICPCSCPVIIHNKPNKHASMAFRGHDSFNIGPALSHYCCFQVVDADTKALVISDTVEFQHDYLESPKVSYEDRGGG